VDWFAFRRAKVQKDERRIPRPALTTAVVGVHDVAECDGQGLMTSIVGKYVR
jgi:hypothetical protein